MQLNAYATERISYDKKTVNALYTKAKNKHNTRIHYISGNFIANSLGNIINAWIDFQSVNNL